MYTRPGLRLVYLGTLWLALLLCSTAMSGPQRTLEGKPDDLATVLSAPSSITIRRGETTTVLNVEPLNLQSLSEPRMALQTPLQTSIAHITTTLTASASPPVVAQIVSLRSILASVAIRPATTKAEQAPINAPAHADDHARACAGGKARSDAGVDAADCALFLGWRASA